MKVEATSRWVGIIAGIGASFTSILITISSNNDPVNVPKLVALASFAGALAGIWVLNFKSAINSGRTIPIISLLMLIGMVASIVFTREPFVQIFYGVTGRNTGALTYLVLILILCSSQLLKFGKHLKYIAFGLYFATVWNTAYGLLQVTGHDPVDWTNPYNNFIGTFGNPDFSSAFMGIGITALIPILFSKATNLLNRIAIASVTVIGAYEIETSNAIQGKVILVIGSFLYLLFYLRIRFKSQIPLIGATAIGVFGFIISLLGTLQIGPLKEFLYKPSVTLRGFYWDAGLSMFKDSPFFGKGFDSYGDYYTQYRSASSVLSPGSIETVTNSAHNVVIDMLTSGGLIFTLPYLALVLVLLFRITKKFMQNEIRNMYQQSLYIAWVGYMFQSFVSINQIGLAVWGWLLLGVVYASTNNNFIYDDDNVKSNKLKIKKSSRSLVLTPKEFIASSAGLILLLVISLPPQIADANWMSAMRSRDINKLIDASFAFPLSSWRLAETSRVLLQNGFKDQALEIAKKAVEFNPRSYNAWITLGNNPLTSESQKKEIKKKLSYLDPRDPEWKR